MTAANAVMRKLQLLLLGLALCWSLPSPTATQYCRKTGLMRLSGGAPDSAKKSGEAAVKKDVAEGVESLKASAQRRADQAKAAGKAQRSGVIKTIGRILFTITNRMGLTGSSTRIVNGKIIMKRNPIQKLVHAIYIFIRAVYFFFKTLFVPLATLDRPKPSGGGPGRGNFSSLNKKREMRMADLPPMPGG